MNRMQELYPRLLGGLMLVFAVVLQRGALDWPSDLAWGAFAAAWLVTAVALVLGRRTALGGLSLAVLAGILFLGPGRQLNDALTLFIWLGLAVAVTDRRPMERALLVRVTVTTAYAFACLSKLNPSFLTGEQIIALSVDRAQLHGFEALFRNHVGVAIAWATTIGEGVLAVALWFRRTRVAAAIGGTVMSATFVFAVQSGTVWDVGYLIVLTMALVVSYLAFFCPIRPQPDDDGGDRRLDPTSTTA